MREILQHLLPAAVTKMLLPELEMSRRERERSILRNKALFMSLFAFDVILLSVLYVTAVLMVK